jgi:hypothetical protein
VLGPHAERDDQGPLRQVVQAAAQPAARALRACHVAIKDLQQSEGRQEKDELHGPIPQLALLDLEPGDLGVHAPDRRTGIHKVQQGRGVQHHTWDIAMDRRVAQIGGAAARVPYEDDPSAKLGSQGRLLLGGAGRAQGRTGHPGQQAGHKAGALEHLPGPRTQTSQIDRPEEFAERFLAQNARQQRDPLP